MSHKLPLPVLSHSVSNQHVTLLDIVPTTPKRMSAKISEKEKRTCYTIKILMKCVRLGIGIGGLLFRPILKETNGIYPLMDGVRACHTLVAE